MWYRQWRLVLVLPGALGLCFLGGCSAAQNKPQPPQPPQPTTPGSPSAGETPSADKPKMPPPLPGTGAGKPKSSNQTTMPGNPAPTASSEKNAKETESEGGLETQEVAGAAANAEGTGGRDTSASTGTKERGGAEGPPPGSALTPDERRQGLDRQFGQSLSEFDAQLARKQREIDARRRESPDPALSRGGGAPGSPGSPTSAGSGSGSANAGKAGETGAGTESGIGTEPAGSGGEKEGTARTAGASRSGAREDGGTLEPGTTDARYTGADPPNLPDPADDDVVARQLREAAEKEADPAIRARLWEEYLAYRRSTGSAKR